MSRRLADRLAEMDTLEVLRDLQMDAPGRPSVYLQAGTPLQCTGGHDIGILACDLPSLPPAAGRRRGTPVDLPAPFADVLHIVHVPVPQRPPVRSWTGIINSPMLDLHTVFEQRDWKGGADASRRHPVLCGCCALCGAPWHKLHRYASGTPSRRRLHTSAGWDRPAPVVRPPDLAAARRELAEVLLVQAETLARALGAPPDNRIPTRQRPDGSFEIGPAHLAAALVRVFRDVASG